MVFHTSPEFCVIGECPPNACVVAVGWSPLFCDRPLATFGEVLYWNYHQGPLTFEGTANTEDIVLFKDRLNATICVSWSDSYLALKTNRRVDTSSVDTISQPDCPDE